MLTRLRKKVEKWAADYTVRLSGFLAFLSLFIVAAVSFFRFDDLGALLDDVLIEAWGLAFDLVVIGWLVFWFNKLSERRLSIRRYNEEIRDFLRWESDEAMHRISGSIRRLNQMGERPNALSRAYLSGTSLNKADLKGVNIIKADFSEAHLLYANLQGVVANEVNLEEASLDQANLEGADLQEANLHRAYLALASLKGCKLDFANLENAVLPEADLREARMINANLTMANFNKTDLRRAHIASANLEGVSLWQADLRGARINLPRLCKAGTLYQAKMDEEVRRYVEENCPKLFEEPEWHKKYYR